jgi:uncharacterized protein YvpB
MSLLYLFIIVLFIFLILLLKQLLNKNILRLFGMTFVILSVMTAAFFVDFFQNSHIAKAIDNVKYWFQSPVIKTNSFLEDNFNVSIIEIKESVLIDAPIIRQLPELPRGCEVTSLAMLLQHTGVNVDKMVLADKITKNPATYQVQDGKIYFGHPNDGFVGDMYTFNNPGLGVYHKPIAELAEHYAPENIADLTGSDFQELKIHLSDGRPIWVITNTHYKRLSGDFFKTWHTPSGVIDITYKEHSVLVTGYDAEYVYFNDPLSGEKNKKAPIKDFEESWVQMGRQAITYIHR